MANTTPLLTLHTLRLRLPRDASFHFFHGPTVYATLLDRLDNPLHFPPGTRIWPVESGRVRYTAGSGYHIGLVTLPDATHDAYAWSRLLCAPPVTHYGRSTRAPLGRGLTLDGVVRHGPAQTDHAAWTLDDLRRATSPLRGQRSLRLTLRSPLQVFRTPVKRRTHVLDGEVFEVERFYAAVARSLARQLPAALLDHLAPDGLFAGAPPSVTTNELVRADVVYHGSKRLLAAKGAVVLTWQHPPDEATLIALLLGGLIGGGKLGNMGFGRYTVAGVELGFPPAPARSLLARAATEAAFAAARDATARAGPTPGVDEGERSTFVETLNLRAAGLQRVLAAGELRARPLRGLVLQRPDGKLRGLALPTIEDRFLQRVVMQELGPAVEALLESSSFAYRPGLCRRTAEAAIRRARDAGYSHTLDADLRAFFDEVDHDRLETRLRAFFDEGPLVDLLMAWVRAPVRFGDETIPRDKGLPQGAAISPLLANFFLDAFDEGLAERGFRLVRYADDFVVLCRSEAEVARARVAVEEELAELGLSLAEDKTSHTSFERGFAFLGFFFCKGMVIERAAQRRAEGKGPKAKGRVLHPDSWAQAVALRPPPRDPAGWLAGLFRAATDLGAGAPADRAGQDANLPAGRWKRPVVPASRDRRPVYVVGAGVRLTGARRGLRVWRKGELVEQIAWRRVQEIAVIGGHHLGSSLFQQALRHRVPVSFHRRDGRPTGLLLPEGVQTPGPLARQQWRWIEQPEGPLAAARALVEAKIHNQRLVARRQRGDEHVLRQRLADAAASAMRVGTVERLRGIEGRAAHDWFAAWPRWLRGHFPFPGRTGRGARDPINACLNLLYTLLFRRCWLALIRAGLDPYCGVLHEGRGRYAALAADLQEPFRFLCDRLVLDLVHRGRLHPEQFLAGEKHDYRVRIGDEAMRLLIGEWEKRLTQEVQAMGVRASYGRHIELSAERLADVVNGERADIGAFRLKW